MIMTEEEIVGWLDHVASGDQLYIIALIFCPEIARRSHPSEMDDMSMGTQALIDHIVSKVPSVTLSQVISFLKTNDYRQIRKRRST